MATPMKIKIIRADLFITELKTRLPFKYGIATMTEAPHIFLRLRTELNGRPAEGYAADFLPPKWFTKDPTRPLAAEVDEMVEVIEHAVELTRGKTWPSVFDAWLEIYRAQQEWGRNKNLPPLLVNFGTSVVERAMIHAMGMIVDLWFTDVFKANVYGIRLSDIHPELTDSTPRDYLPADPLERITVRHTIGLADPLSDADIPPEERLDDGLPQSLTACIQTYGLRHFKLKVSGDRDRDLERIQRIAALLATHAPADFAFSLDGNEQFHTLDEFRAFWEAITHATELRTFFQHLLFVEQPFHRDVALDPDQMAGLKDWTERPLLIIDESDAEWDSLPRALQLGYVGTSHKNCKGVFRSIANHCLLARRRQEQPGQPFLQTGEDLANIGPVALLQDLAVCAALNISSVERNGHHYFAGLSMMPGELQAKVLEHHETLYHKSRDGWPTLTIRDGMLDMTSINAAAFGLQGWMGSRFFTTIEAWKFKRRYGAL